MPATIPDLWSDDIQVDIIAPVAILRAQGAFLERKTQGLLRTDVATTSSNEFVSHSLDLIAPALDSYRVTVIVATHGRDFFYPTIVKSNGLRPSPRSPDSITAKLPPVAPDGERRANTQEEFIELIRKALQSAFIRSLIQSLIGRSNEATASEPDRNGSAHMPRGEAE